MFMFVQYVMYFQLVNACLVVFKCDALGYWEQQSWIPCDAAVSGEYLVLLVLGSIFVILYGVGIPVVFACNLQK